MERRAHRNIASYVADYYYLNNHRKKTLRRHTMDPDYNRDYINKLFEEITEEYSEIKREAYRYEINGALLIHSHEFVPNAALFFTRASRILFENSDIVNGYRFLSWGIHYLVDCGTPLHEHSIRACIDVISKDHQKYEKYIDRSLNHFFPFFEDGYGKGLQIDSRYTLRSCQILADMSSDYYDDIIEATENRRYQYMRVISEDVLYQIGFHLGRMINTYYVII